VTETGVGASRVQVLGPVRVAGPDGWVDVPGVNGKALIVSLVLARGAVVSVPSLIDDIWQDDPPRNARAALQTLVSRVRAVAGEELIESVAGGYRLGTDAIDLWQPESARRGEPGADLGGTELAERLRETADGVRVRALEARVADALRTGSTPEAVDGARALVAAAPYDERACLALMGALAADGRRGEALRAFADFRARLADELGARPGPELVALNAALLRDTAVEDPSDPGPAGHAGPHGDARPARPDGDGHPADAATTPAPAAAASAATTRVGLRAAPNQLIGRDADIAALERLLATARLTTILGPGGLGKTRLAQGLAQRATRTTPGVVVVELAGIREPDDVPLAVAATLGIGEVGAGRLSLRDPIVLLEVRTRIRAALGERETLLVLDNCEHVIEGAAFLVDQILSELPRVRVLATSRAPLQLGAERVYPLEPLSAAPVPADDEPEDGAGRQGPAVELFLERARAARPGAALPLDAVARLCEHLDGLPLAIELAAARIRSMSVDEIERRLSNRFALLRGGDRAAPERHRTLIAVIDWSWNLLSESERRMLRRLSRFPDGFSAAAAAAVVEARDEQAALAAADDLDALVLQSLVSVSEGPAGLRYRMLETVREFGDMALVDAGEDELVAAAQARWARAFARETIAALPTARQAAALRGLETEYDNLVTILRAHTEDEGGETIAPLFAALLFYWLLHNQLREALSFAPTVARVAVGGALPGDAPDAAAITLMFAGIMAVGGMNTPSARQRERHGDVGLPPELEELPQLPPATLLRAAVRAGARLRALTRAGTVSPWLAAVSEVLTAGVRDQTRVLACAARLHGHEDPVVRIVMRLVSGMLRENLGELDAAREDVVAAWRGASRLGLDWVAGQAAQGVAALSSQDDRPADTLEWADRARDLLVTLGAIEDLNQFGWITAVNRLKLGHREGVAEPFERLAHDAQQQDGFDGLDGKAIGWAGLAELAAAEGRPGACVEGYRRAVGVYGSAPGPLGMSPWFFMSGAGALAASVHLDRMDEQGLALWRTLRRAARLTLRARGGAAIVDRPVLATAALGLAVWLLGWPAASDAAREAGAELLALAERLHSRQDQPMLVRARAVALAERAVAASVLLSARERVAALPDLTVATTRVDELLRLTRL
jgi:predicted ATPase/DNA-binding SARP family transcriptional activator